eukprot:jgi/Pico_ML_1/51993/g2775.t1
MQGIRDPYASMDVVIFNKFSTVDELIYSINKTSPVQVVAIYDLSGHKKEFLDQFDDASLGASEEGETDTEGDSISFGIVSTHSSHSQWLFTWMQKKK